VTRVCVSACLLVGECAVLCSVYSVYLLLTV